MANDSDKTKSVTLNSNLLKLALIYSLLHTNLH